MGKHHKLKVVLSTLLPFLLLFLLSYYYYLRRSGSRRRRRNTSPESGELAPSTSLPAETEDLIRFHGGENLTTRDILDAPGEVVGKSAYATLYRALLERRGGGGGGGGAVVLLRFVRPVCINSTAEILPAVRLLGFVRHPNLVPLIAMYIGPRGEKLFVHPYYHAGNLKQFLHEGNSENYKWEVIFKLSLGIARALEHLHTGFQKPIVHGNLKSSNILLDSDYQPRVSDVGLHLILNTTIAQEILEASAAQGYKAPELIKMKNATTESDLYSLGVVFLEMLTRKEPLSIDFLNSKDLHVPTSLRNLILEHKISSTFSSELTSDDENLVRYFQLSMACCSPSPALRPDIKNVVKKLEDIGQ